jgi:DsbC/DsbD-like thiol-disulfide interchange protein
VRRFVRALLSFSLAALAAGESGAVVGPWFETPESKVRLISRFAAASAGGDAGLGLEFRLAPGWHVYWKNAGDAGYPPVVDFDDASVGGSTLRYPAPSRFELPGELVAFGYEGEAVYPVDARLAPGARDRATIAADLDYLICAESCIPYETRLALELPVEREPVDDPATAPLLAAARARLPSPAPAGVRGELATADDGGLSLELTFAVPGIRAAAPDLFFEPHPQLAIGRPAPVATAAGPGFRVPVEAIDPTKALPERLRFAWTSTGFEQAGAPVAWEGELDLARPRRGVRATFVMPFVVALSVFPVLWFILRRARGARRR